MADSNSTPTPSTFTRHLTSTEQAKGKQLYYIARAKAFGAEDYTTSRFSVGFVWRMPVF